MALTEAVLMLLVWPSCCSSTTLNEQPGGTMSKSSNSFDSVGCSFPAVSRNVRTGLDPATTSKIRTFGFDLQLLSFTDANRSSGNWRKSINHSCSCLPIDST
ncbi:hypothetical protein BKA64DRAFT_665912 [Cadophora sp. MPI-SDFR-AT-0126]|nr:hypothetical protein BKA64DRAFT_665912 [Leotiomycetes sp. MPI-SDFR-AT-0126]